MSQYEGRTRLLGRVGRPRRTALVAMATASSLAVIGAPSIAAAAAPYGRVAHFGGFEAGGKKTGKFVLPVGFAVATAEANSVYVLDRIVDQQPVETTPGKLGYRLQKFSSSGNVEGFVTLPVEEYKDHETFSDAHPLISLTVDSEKHRLYALVEKIAESGEGRFVPVAQELVAWSTTPNAKKELVAAEGYTKKDAVTGAALVAEIPTSEATKDLYDPTGIVVDKKTHDVVVEGQDGVNEAHGGPTMLQRVSTATPVGKLGEKWVAEESLAPGKEQADGLFNVSNGSEESFGVKLYMGQVAIARIADVKAAFAKPEASLIAPDHSSQRNYDEAPAIDDPFTLNYNEEYDTHTTLEPYTAGSPVAQLAPGLYAARYGNNGTAQNDAQAELAPWNEHGPVPYFWTEGRQETNFVGNMGVRIFKEGPEGENILTTIGGPEGSVCHLDTAQFSVAAGANEAVFVLTQPNGESDDEVIEFAPGGGEGACPQGASGKLEVNGTPTESATVSAGALVKFDAISLERAGETPYEFDWKFEEGEGFVLGSKIEEAGEYRWPSPESSHTYSTTGKRVVEVRVIGDYGTSVIKVPIEVVPKQNPIARFTGPTSATVGHAVEFNASESKPSGGTEITKYRWEFGDETPPVNRGHGEPTVEHEFATPCTCHVKLTIIDFVEGKEVTAETTQEVTVTEESTSTPPTSSGSGSNGGSSGGTTHEEPKHEEAKVSVEPSGPTPSAAVARVAPGVSSAGAVAVTVACPAGNTSCAGTVQLRTATAVVATGKHRKSAPLVLGQASFSVIGGGSRTVQIRMSSKGLALLRKHHSLKAIATITTTVGGRPHVTTESITLHVVSSTRGGRKGRHR